LHLQTRFAQLETASVLHLYTEGFRTVEDIYNILQISHARRKLHPELPPPKAKLMAAYYEKLTTLFWVSENHLFHAFAWYKYHNLCKEYNRGMSPDLKRKHASAVLLAALCIPTMEQEDTQFEDASRKEKMARMATLLGFHTRNPTREALLEEIQSRGIFEQVPEYLQQLYYLLEEDSDPLVLVEKATPLLAQLAQETGSSTGMAASENNEDDNKTAVDTTLGRYVQPLTDVLLLKLLLNLNSAYHTVKMDHLQLLTEGLGMTFEHVEKSIVLFTQSHKGLVVRMDHRAGCLRFGDAQLESDAMRSQLTTLAHQLETVCTILDPSMTKIVPAGDRAAAYQTIRDTREADHAAILVRKAKIEGRKEESERLTLEKVKEEQTKKAVEEAARRAEEERRIVREQHVREQEKQKKIQREMDNTKKQQLLEAMGQNTEAMTQDEIAEIDTAKLQKEHQDKINKKKEAVERKTKAAAKRLDYLCRAIRIEELPLVKTKYEEKNKTDKDQYEQEVIEKAKRAKIQWEADIKDKKILSDHAVFDHMKALEDKVMEGRRLQHVVLCRQADEDAEIKAEKAKMDRARRRKLDEEKRAQQEDARRQKEEDEIQAEDERRRRENARREKDAEEEERRQAELARMQDERDRKDKEQASRAPPGGGGKYVPPSNRGGGGGGGGPSGGSRFGGGGDRYAGGGRYEGRDGGGDRRDGGGDRRGGGGGAGGAYGDRDRRDGGGGGGAYGGDRDRRDGGGDGGGNSRWKR
jgi:translation initiation factor 3 subunit A